MCQKRVKKTKNHCTHSHYSFTLTRFLYLARFAIFLARFSFLSFQDGWHTFKKKLLLLIILRRIRRKRKVKTKLQRERRFWVREIYTKRLELELSSMHFLSHPSPCNLWQICRREQDRTWLPLQAPHPVAQSTIHVFCPPCFSLSRAQNASISSVSLKMSWRVQMESKNFLSIWSR